MTYNTRVHVLDTSRRCEPSGFLFNRVLNFLRMNGYELQDDPQLCDTIIVNSCCVTQDKIDEARLALAQMSAWLGTKRVILFGCWAGLREERDLPAAVERVGPKELHRLNDLFAHQLPIEAVTVNALDDTVFLPYQRQVGQGDYYVLVAQGCGHNCSYCNIKLVKGAPVSTPYADIEAQVLGGLRSGRTEITLLADDIGSYGLDQDTNVAELLARLLALDPALRLKVMNLFPATLLKLHDALVPSLCSDRISYLNIPLQSGARRILELMRRDYDPAAVCDAVRAIRAVTPGTWLYTHILFGFPSETRAEFEQSLAAAACFDEALFICYSDNQHTRASKLAEKVAPEELQMRFALACDFLRDNHRGLVVSPWRVASYRNVAA